MMAEEKRTSERQAFYTSFHPPHAAIARSQLLRLTSAALQTPSRLSLCVVLQCAHHLFSFPVSSPSFLWLLISFSFFLSAVFPFPLGTPFSFLRSPLSRLVLFVVGFTRGRRRTWSCPCPSRDASPCWSLSASTPRCRALPSPP